MELAEPIQLITFKREFFSELVYVLHDQSAHKASKPTIQLLINVFPWGHNPIKAVEVGTMFALIDILLETAEKRVCEQCAEGRAELLKHGAGLAVVPKKILRVSQVRPGVRVLLSVSKFSANNSSVVQEMLQLGVVAKLCLVLQVDRGSKTKEKAREILKLHAKSWKNSSCLPMSLLSSYPS
ncbi:LOW QUALITY PROTEIN: hypothetical protein RJ639_011884 [Escallonia herrerae]|uniref:U-box domain-containing protein n=1 Tax=Escallonia herrerae TaxID=1293975 RepID=A0AA89AS85_9ASTE|nr:LOW QUALITY PROTEIN: hypothetical protein RJ639_011884 [Escallonia herrerae]